MQYTKNHWREDTTKAYRQIFVFAVIAAVGISFAFASLTLYFDRVNHSKLTPNCGWFTSIVEATTFTVRYPQYKYILNPINKAQACTSYIYARR